MPFLQLCPKSYFGIWVSVQTSENFWNYLDLIELYATDFNGVVVVRNYLKRTGREAWARQVSFVLSFFLSFFSFFALFLIGKVFFHIRTREFGMSSKPC